MPDSPPEPQRDGAADRPPTTTDDVIDGPAPPSPTADDPTDGPAADEWRRAGTSTFTIEGRSAPALFVVGWLATIVGLGMIVVGFLSGGGAAARILIVLALLVLSVGLIAAAGSQGIERRSRARLRYRGPSPFLVFAAAIPISLLAVIALSIPLVAFGAPVEGPLGALLSVATQAVVYVGLVRLLVVDTGALDWQAMGIRALDRFGLTQMASGALWAVPVILLTAIVANILLAIFPVNPTSPLPPTGTTIGFIVSFIAGALVAPFGEEILFRGFATTAWVQGMGMRRGLVVGALFFAFAHVLTVGGTSAGDAFELALVAFLGRIPVALALGFLFLRRGTIWASFGLHAAFNGLLLILAEMAVRSI